jgi:uncharacterized protein DUF5677
MKTGTREWDARKARNIFEEYFSKQISLLEDFWNYKLSVERLARLDELSPLIFSINKTGKAISILVDAGLAGETFIIARSFLEKSVDLCYLIMCGQEEVTDYIDYCFQKSYRSYCSKQKASKIFGSKIDIPKPTPRIQEIINKFSSAKGREITRWSKKSFRDRMLYVKLNVPAFSDDKFAIYEYIYEDASEATHGTSYGNLFFTGIFSGLHCEHQLSDYMDNYLSLILFNFGFLIKMIFLAMKSKTDLDISDIIRKIEENEGQVRKHFD